MPVKTNGGSTKVTRNDLIRRFIIENLWTTELSMPMIARQFGVNRSLVAQVAREIIPTYSGDSFRLSGKGEWGNLRHLKKVYGLSKDGVSCLYSTRRDEGRPIRRKLILTDGMVLSGEYFYSLRDIDKFSPRLKRRKKIRSWLSKFWTKEIPRGLTDEEFALLAVIYLLLEEKRVITIRALRQAIGFVDSESVRQVLSRLESGGYITISGRHRYLFSIAESFPRELWDCLVEGPRLKAPFPIRY